MLPLHVTHLAPRTPWLAWSFEPLPAIALAMAAVAYAAGLAGARRRGRPAPGAGRIAAFYAGLGAIGLALLGPPDAFADDSFLVHMLQHLLMLILAPRLLIEGRPVQVALRAAPPATVRAISGRLGANRAWRIAARVLASPWFVFLAYNVNLVLWHVPRYYEAALRSAWVHELEHALFFGTALLFWWIIVDPHPRHHKASPHAVYALSMTTCLAGNVLAAALTLSPEVLYGWYAERGPNPFGLDPLVDQRLGGAVMWAGGLVYFGVLFSLLAREGAGAGAPEGGAARVS